MWKTFVNAPIRTKMFVKEPKRFLKNFLCFKKVLEINCILFPKKRQAFPRHQDDFKRSI